MNDINGQRLEEGDRIVFATSTGHSAGLRVGTITRLDEETKTVPRGDGHVYHYTTCRVWYKNDKSGKVTEFGCNADVLLLDGAM